MNKFKNLSNDTVLRIKVPAHLYESVKKELSKNKINEAGDIPGVNKDKAPVIKNFGANKTPGSKPPGVAAFPRGGAAKSGDSKVDAMLNSPAFKAGAPAVDKPGEIKTILQNLLDGDESKSTLLAAKAYIDGLLNKPEQIKEWVGLDPALYNVTTIAGLGLPAVVALIAAGPKNVGKAVYDLAVKAKEKLAGKKDSGNQPPVAEEYSEE